MCIVPEVTDETEIGRLMSWAAGEDFFASIERMENWLSESARIDLAAIPVKLAERVRHKQQLVEIRLRQLAGTKGGGS
jgi:hypothetical protein